VLKVRRQMTDAKRNKCRPLVTPRKSWMMNCFQYKTVKGMT